MRHIVKLANNRIRTLNVYKTTYHDSRGRSLIGRAGVLISGHSPLVPKFLRRDNFGDDGHVALGTSQGFLNFSKTKYLGGDSVIWQSSPILALFDLKSFFQKDLPDWTLWYLLVSHCTCETRFRTAGVQIVRPFFSNLSER